MFRNRTLSDCVSYVPCFQKRVTLTLLGKKGDNDVDRGTVDLTVHWRYNLDVEGTCRAVLWLSCSSHIVC